MSPPSSGLAIILVCWVGRSQARKEVDDKNQDGDTKVA